MAYPREGKPAPDSPSPQFEKRNTMADDELYPTPDEYDDYTMKDSPTYMPPKVWQWDQDGDENRFSKINRPIAGATHEKDLPVGEHPLQLY